MTDADTDRALELTTEQAAALRDFLEEYGHLADRDRPLTLTPLWDTRIRVSISPIRREI